MFIMHVSGAASNSTVVNRVIKVNIHWEHCPQISVMLCYICQVTVCHHINECVIVFVNIIIVFVNTNSTSCTKCNYGGPLGCRPGRVA